MSLGWSGKILRVDLSNGRTWTEDTEPYTRLFIGGKGINVKMMYDEVGPKVGPFDPDNMICFGPGVLTGTLAPAHSRMKITSVSPNGLLQNSGIGGYIPAEIRKAGYDNITIQGKSDKPIYLYINNDKIEIRDATHIWGKDTQETQRAIKDEIGDWVKVACIGPAGENLVSFSCIVTGKGSAAARGGFGAIMGSKNLKAIAARGTGHVKIARPSEFLETCKQTHLWLPDSNPLIRLQSKQGHGDKYSLGKLHEAGSTFLGNWEEHEASWDRIGDYGGAEEFYEECATHQYGCYGCPVHHFHIFNIPGMGRGTTKCTQWKAFASRVWVNDRKVIVQANTLCQNYGLDSTATGNAVSFLMELYRRGIIGGKDTDGIPIERGDQKAIFATIEKIGKQEGFGRLFRDGVLGAAKKIGNDAEKCAVVVNGQEAETYEFRAFRSHALAAAISDGSVSHAWTTVDVTISAPREDREKLAQERFGSKEAAVPNSYEKKALLVFDQENRNTAGDMLGTCRWLIPWEITELDIPAKLFSQATGREITEHDLLQAAQRTFTLERAFRAGRGVRRDTLPKRLFKTAVPDGIYKGERLDKQKFEDMLDEYYSLRGWDRNGIPLEEAFMKFGLTSEWKTFSKHLRKEE
jgi:aldehyde:ferredoxin oxidoreductase